MHDGHLSTCLDLLLSGPVSMCTVFSHNDCARRSVWYSGVSTSNFVKLAPCHSYRIYLYCSNICTPLVQYHIGTTTTIGTTTPGARLASTHHVVDCKRCKCTSCSGSVLRQGTFLANLLHYMPGRQADLSPQQASGMKPHICRQAGLCCRSKQADSNVRHITKK